MTTLINPKYAKYIRPEEQHPVDPLAKSKMVVAGLAVPQLHSSNVKLKIKKYKIVSDNNGVVRFSLAPTDLQQQDMWVEISNTIVLDTVPYVEMNVSEMYNPNFSAENNEFEYTNAPNTYYFSQNQDSKYKLMLQAAQEIKLNFSYNLTTKKVAIVLTSPLLLKF